MPSQTFNSLKKRAGSLPAPKNYFKGFTPSELCIPENLILFSRTTRDELQKRSFESHPHQRFVLAINLETEGTITTDGIPWRIHPMEAFLIFPYQFHQFTELAKDRIVWLFITFEIEIPSILEVFRHRILAVDERMLESLDGILDRYHSQRTERNKRALTLEIAYLLNRLREQLAISPKTSISQQSGDQSEKNLLLQQVQECLRHETGELHTVSKIAAQLNMSESNLRAKFRSQFGLSLGFYVRNFRTHQAILLLKNPALSLTDISYELGFTTLAAFSRFFSNATGSAPKTYRAKLLN
ncbi:helix-turn-helix domain-containing protein [Pelagicoccus mobilis]|uniref:Helix-turn-helix transcriptional regulator n=1 Tax=Pelagicoccus mobilis TaxID=415221 RepID=A0A934RWU3_9BACT|nr:AraC family transcriptional regulator [Pelagicoccus mobilis]MBK1875847.1 helix-turn-helix transcriptional regulator [Pelagicoccus mobilis]